MRACATIAPSRPRPRFNLCVPAPPLSTKDSHRLFSYGLGNLGRIRPYLPSPATREEGRRVPGVCDCHVPQLWNPVSPGVRFFSLSVPIWRHAAPRTCSGGYYHAVAAPRPRVGA